MLRNLKHMLKKAGYNVTRDFWEDMNFLAQDEMTSHPPFASLLPMIAYDEETHLFSNTGSLGFMMEFAPFLGAGDQFVKNTISQLFTGESIAGLCIQSIQYASPTLPLSSYVNSFVRNKFFPEGRRDFLEGQTWQPRTPHPLVVRDVRNFLCVSLPLGEREDTVEDQLLSLKKSLGHIFSADGVPYELLSDVGLLSYLRSILGVRLLPLVESQSLRDQVVGADFSFEVKGVDTFCMRSGGETRYGTILTPRKLPSLWPLWAGRQLWGEEGLDQKKIHIPTITVATMVTVDGKKCQNKIHRKASVYEHQSKYPLLTKLEPRLLSKREEIDFVKRQTKDGVVVVQSFYHVLCMSHSVSLLQENVQRLMQIYRMADWELECEKYIHAPSFLFTLPFMPVNSRDKGDYAKSLTHYGRSHTVFASNWLNMCPLMGDYKGNSSTGIPFISRFGQLWFWDPFVSEGNYNVALVGRSGSGKSVLLQEMVTNLYGRGGKVIVLDDGFSFKNSALLQGGEFVNFTLDATISLNPFARMQLKGVEDEQQYVGECLAGISDVVRSMCAGEGVLNQDEVTAITQAVDTVWKEQKTEGSFINVEDTLRSHKDKGIKKLADRLYPYTRGAYRGLLNGGEGYASVDMNSDLTVFELSPLKQQRDIQKLVILLLIFSSYQSMVLEDRAKTKSIVIDEAWDLLSGTYVQAFIERVARTARKYRGNLITGTQSVNDYYANPAAQAFFENSQWTVFLQQNKSSVEFLKTTGKFALDAELEEKLHSLNQVRDLYSECLISSGGNGNQIGRILLDELSISAFTSTGEDVASLNRALKEGMSVEEALTQKAEEIRKRRGSV